MIGVCCPEVANDANNCRCRCAFRTRRCSSGLGDWYANPQKFPQGMKPLIDHVNGLGLDLGLWVEPEMINPDSDLYRQHPDWVITFPGRPRSELRNVAASQTRECRC